MCVGKWRLSLSVCILNIYSLKNWWNSRLFLNKKHTASHHKAEPSSGYNLIPTMNLLKVDSLNRHASQKLDFSCEVMSR